MMANQQDSANSYNTVYLDRQKDLPLWKLIEHYNRHIIGNRSIYEQKYTEKRFHSVWDLLN